MDLPAIKILIHFKCDTSLVTEVSHLLLMCTKSLVGSFKYPMYNYVYSLSHSRLFIVYIVYIIIYYYAHAAWEHSSSFCDRKVW